MLVTMSDKEIHRLPVIQAVCEKRLRRRDAASQLGISEVRRNDLSIVTEFLVLKDLSAANAASPATAG